MALSRALVFTALLRSSVAVLVATNSPCGTDCGNVLDSTTSSDITCKIADFGKSAGVIWESCLTCELTSPYTTVINNENRTDLQAMLYNMRYATAYCLFGEPDNEEVPNTPCITRTACGPLRDSILYDNLASNVSAYGYCSVWSDTQVPHCTECLDDLLDDHYLTNYINILDGACKMQPTPGSTLSVEGEVFSTDIVNVTTPTPSSALTHQLSGPLSLGGVVGVVIGGVIFLLILIGCAIVINGKRKRKAYLRRRERERRNWPSPIGVGEMFETPVSQRPLRGWDESPVSAETESTYPRYFSPYSSQYNSPVSAADGPSTTNWPAEKNINIGVALSPEDSPSNPFWGDKKDKGKERAGEDREGIELQEGVSSGGGIGGIGQYPYVPPPPPPNPPTLGHPGYGRYGPNPKHHPGTLTEEDHMSGRAV